MTTQATYSRKDWETLQFAPLWTFSAVAGADEDIDDREKEALGKELAEAALYKNPLVREVLFSIRENLPEVVERYSNDSRTLDRGLSQVADILERETTAGEADNFKRTMVGIGIEIAKASGPALGGPVSEEEKAAIALVAGALRVNLA